MSKTFQSCMLEWWDADKLETKFGNQPDHKLKWFDTVPAEELPWLECYGGRGTFSPPIGRLISIFDVGQPRAFSVSPNCYTTSLGLCKGKAYPGCAANVPGSANCYYP